MAMGLSVRLRSGLWVAEKDMFLCDESRYGFTRVLIPEQISQFMDLYSGATVRFEQIDRDTLKVIVLRSDDRYSMRAIIAS